MSNDFYSLELQVRERIDSKYKEADAERLASLVTRNSPIRHKMRTSSARVLKKVTQVVKDVIHHKKRPSPVPR